MNTVKMETPKPDKMYKGITWILLLGGIFCYTSTVVQFYLGNFIMGVAPAVQTAVLFYLLATVTGNHGRISLTPEELTAIVNGCLEQWKRDFIKKQLADGNTVTLDYIATEATTH